MVENSKESKENETRWIFRDSMVEDLIEALEASKTEYEGRGLDFEGNLVKLYSQLRKTMSEKYEETDFGPTAVSEPTKSREKMSKEEFKEHKKNADELNPGPNGSSNCLVKANTRNTNNVKIAHLNLRSLKCQDHFLLVKETILSKKFDVFTITESWLDASVSDLETEVPGYNIYRVDQSNKTGAGSVLMS
ncbi:hypothetical protein P5673_005270 [Acropora cervicornis]|uniref:RNA-directed DNA polymerase from mobile element jockey n=1 Tax=Acropora cervicornis TaxID=6130 RepID=A0AAD9VDG3_ACRCE|nr:hypothetical protein P5673_005270 [Acropora cervicornis]